MEASGKFKKTAFGGFKRKDVLAYIDRISSEYVREQAELKQQLEELIKKESNHEQIVSRLKENINELEERLKAQNEANEQLEEKIKILAEDIEQKKDMLTEKDRQYTLALEENRQLASKNEALADKCRKFDEASFEIGKAVMYAKKSADNIINEAVANAREIEDSARLAADEFRKNINRFKTELLEARRDFENSVKNVELKIDGILVVTEKGADEIVIKNVGETQLPLPTEDMEFFR